MGKNYNSSMERMVQDKFNMTLGLSKIPLFAVLGGLTLGAFGLSRVMTKEDYHSYFAYKGGFDSRLMNLPRAMIGNDNPMSALCTGISLIGLGTYMHMKTGPIVMLKFTALSVFGVAMSW